MKPSLNYFTRSIDIVKIAKVLSSSSYINKNNSIKSPQSMAEINSVRRNQDQPINTMKTRYVNTPSVSEINSVSHLTNRYRSQQNNKLINQSRGPISNPIQVSPKPNLMKGNNNVP